MYPIQVSVWCKTTKDILNMQRLLRKSEYETNILERFSGKNSEKYPYALFRAITKQEEEEIERGTLVLDGDNLKLNKYLLLKSNKKEIIECTCVCCGKIFMGAKRKRSFCHNCKQKAQKDSSGGMGMEWKTSQKNNRGSRKGVVV